MKNRKEGIITEAVAVFRSEVIAERNMTKHSPKSMFPLFETIRVEHGRVSNLTYHWARISHSCREIFGCDPKFQLDAILANEAVKYSGLHRLKFSYNPEQYQTEVAPYAVRAVESLKLVVDNEIPYQHKFSDRSRLEALSGSGPRPMMC